MYGINFENIKQSKNLLESAPCVMYGAGGNGQRILNVFRENNITVNYFCDDNHNKWNKNFCDVPVISFEELCRLSEHEKVNVVLTSVFAGPILGKLEKLKNVEVYEAFSILIDRYYSKSFYNVPLEDSERKYIAGKIDFISEKLADHESSEILSRIKYTITHPEEKDYSRFFPVASRENCYFVREVINSLPPEPVIVDCGGFTGDLMSDLKNHNISYKKVYSFEANKDLFLQMNENIRANNIQDRFIPINKAVWDKTGFSFLNVNADDIAGGNIRDEENYGEKVETVSLDDFFGDTHYDFVKMDIEGAELRVLRGGGLNFKSSDSRNFALSFGL